MARDALACALWLVAVTGGNDNSALLAPDPLDPGLEGSARPSSGFNRGEAEGDPTGLEASAATDDAAAEEMPAGAANAAPRPMRSGVMASGDDRPPPTTALLWLSDMDAVRAWLSIDLPGDRRGSAAEEEEEEELLKFCGVLECVGSVLKRPAPAL